MAEERDRMTAAEVTIGLCESCKELRPVAHRDPLGREWCGQCFALLPEPLVSRIVNHLVASIPFRIGDRVECRMAAVLFDGIGTIEEVSIEPEKFGTPAYPSFRVRFTEKAYPEVPEECWYMETQLKRVDEDSDPEASQGDPSFPPTEAHDEEEK